MSQDVDWQALGPKVVSLAAQGLPNAEIAARVNCPRELVLEWRKQFYADARGGVARSETRAA